MRTLTTVNDALATIDPELAIVYRNVFGLAQDGSADRVPMQSLSEIARRQGCDPRRVRDRLRTVELHVLKHLVMAQRLELQDADPLTLHLLNNPFRAVGRTDRLAQHPRAEGVSND
jgi:hypothetical protein